MRRKILVLGTGHFIADAVSAALRAGDWATPVPFRDALGKLDARSFEGIDGIFNGAAGNTATIASTARSLYPALRRAQPTLRVVHLSSMTVYGGHTGEASEATPVRADIGAYGAAQIEAEALAVQMPGHVILRPGCEYGPGCPDWTLRIARLLDEHRLGDLGAAGDGVCNLVYIDDLVAGILSALRLPGLDGRCFNLGMSSASRWNEYFMRFAKALSAVPVSRIGARRLAVERQFLGPPLKALELIARRARITRTPPPITASLLNLCGQDIVLNTDAAAAALQLTWTPLPAGLEAAAAWYRESHPMGNTSMRRNSMG